MVGKRLRERRTQAGLSAAELAEALSPRLDRRVWPAEVGSWERGERVPRPDELETFAGVVDSSVNLLLSPASETNGG